MHSAGTPQVYPVCFQAELSGSGSAKPSDTTTFPAAYDLNDMFKTYVISDVSLDHTSFIPPGPAVYGGGGSSGSASENSAAAGGNDTAVASDGAPAQASSQQSSVATSAKAASTVSSSSNTAAVSVEPASSESSISAGLMIWLIFPGQAGAGSTAISAESPGSSGDCMAQMVC
jgi:hypothetical protein